jgi:hypothetical protein
MKNPKEMADMELGMERLCQILTRADPWRTADQLGQLIDGSDFAGHRRRLAIEKKLSPVSTATSAFSSFPFTIQGAWKMNQRKRR